MTTLTPMTTTARDEGNSNGEDSSSSSVAATSGIHDDAMNADRKKKVVYLIRHAESEENVDMASLFDAAGAIRKFQLPRKQDTQRGFHFLGGVMAGNTNAPLSDHGKRQSQEMGVILGSEKFLEKHQIQLIVYSPLIRARDTCQNMLLSNMVVPGDDSSNSSSVQQQQQQRVEQLEFLREATPFEQLVTVQHSLRTRISNFQQWLAVQTEDRIAVVGHSQYFKIMLGMSEKFQNVDVWVADFIHEDSSSVGVSISTTIGSGSICAGNLISPNPWKDIKLIYRFSQLEKQYSHLCAMKKDHPM